MQTMSSHISPKDRTPEGHLQRRCEHEKKSSISARGDHWLLEASLLQLPLPAQGATGVQLVVILGGVHPIFTHQHTTSRSNMLMGACPWGKLAAVKPSALELL